MRIVCRVTPLFLRFCVFSSKGLCTKQSNKTYRFISDLMDIFCAVGTVKQTEQPNYLAEGLVTGVSVSAQLPLLANIAMSPYLSYLFEA
eukprot:1161986-Pelagomonas_calceolata.AAC.10